MTTRTAKVRIELANAEGLLIPGMFASVEVAAPAGEAVLTVPDSALIDSGARQVVLVARGEGLFEPRAVTVGRRANNMVEIVTGLEGRRDRRHLGDVPDRRRKQFARGVAGLRRGQAMIAAVIRWSAGNILLVMVGHGAGDFRRRLCRSHDAGRCDPRSVGHASHHLHRVSGPSAASGRGSGHLSADHGDAERAEVARGARVFLFRGQFRLCDFRRRRRSLLGAQRACSNI